MLPSKDRVNIAGTIDPVLRNTIGAIITLVRAKMRDYPELNRLTSGRESSDRDIALAMLLMIDQYNATPPLLDAEGIVNFPSKDLLVTGTMLQLIDGLILLKMRNQLSYSDGSTQQQTENPQLYQSYYNQQKQRYDQDKKQFKMAKNLADAMSTPQGVSSEYLAINMGGFFDSSGTLNSSY